MKTKEHTRWVGDKVVEQPRSHKATKNGKGITQLQKLNLPRHRKLTKRTELIRDAAKRPLLSTEGL